MDEPDLKKLAADFQQGDQRSFKILVETLSRTLMAMAYRYTGDWEWARDLTQETWIRVSQGIGRYDPERSFTSWLYAVHRNGCLDHLRRPWVRLETTTGDEALPERLASESESPEARVERKEFHQRIIQAASELSDTQREVFLRVDLEQGDQKTVAARLGIRPGTLRTTLHYARKRMALALREMEESS